MLSEGEPGERHDHSRCCLTSPKPSRRSRRPGSPTRPGRRPREISCSSPSACAAREASPRPTAGCSGARTRAGSWRSTSSAAGSLHARCQHHSRQPIVHTTPRTCQSLDLSLRIEAPSTQLMHDHLLLGDRRQPHRLLAHCLREERVVHARPIQVQQPVRAVVLHRAAEHLLINRHGRGALDIDHRQRRFVENAQLILSCTCQSCTLPTSKICMVRTLRHIQVCFVKTIPPSRSSTIAGDTSRRNEGRSSGSCESYNCFSIHAIIQK